MPTPRVPTPPRTCEQCGATYERPMGVSPSKFSRSRFCGRACRDRDNSLNPRGAAYLSSRRRDVVIEDVEWLAGTDSPQNIAARVGYRHLDDLQWVLIRWGRPDLARRLREPDSLHSVGGAA